MNSASAGNSGARSLAARAGLARSAAHPGACLVKQPFVRRHKAVVPLASLLQAATPLRAPPDLRCGLPPGDYVRGVKEFPGARSRACRRGRPHRGHCPGLRQENPGRCPDRHRRVPPSRRDRCGPAGKPHQPSRDLGNRLIACHSGGYGSMPCEFGLHCSIRFCTPELSQFKHYGRQDCHATPRRVIRFGRLLPLPRLPSPAPRARGSAIECCPA